jgi:hypothetical protein
MKNIDKSVILSTAYKEWEENLEAKQLPHPAYNSSQGQFYRDIIMNLYHCQNGLCAYTERTLVLTGLENHCWNQEGRYSADLPSHFGELEHFDESLKPDKGWLWDNLFMVDGKINRKKSSRGINNILKPDLPEYDPFLLLSYDHEKHVFFANTQNTDLTEEDIKSINDMIDILGINYVKDWRRKEITSRIKAIEFGLEPAPLTEFPTAFEMTKQNLGLV